MAPNPAATISAATDELVAAVNDIGFAPPVACVYNPLRYARKMWDRYLERFASTAKRTILLGMNPGPWGMAQTGIPFGEIAAVRDWMALSEEIGRPEAEHPKRPVEGLDCTRSEVSGRRLWSLMAGRFETAEGFFATHFVANYCPLVFMADTGRNITPDKLPADERRPLFRICDEFLRVVVRALEPDYLVGVGKFAESRAETACSGMDDPPKIATILHPSPASPAANRDWAGTVTRQLTELGVW
ncbi:MAG: uracil-DNA glycosylase family protein [Spirochaetota bacterium]